ncbi:hypothetical protein EU556_14020 [Hymenobacter fodinae]|uniref:Uncharacterized protein n=1 Tax=Hymenobacter fodinae TaxID=2510796 RepID=A0A4Z0P366_9BACT|nr:hypothetical protein EU556_14020 [Hymenobacter fodinae]
MHSQIKRRRATNRAQKKLRGALGKAETLCVPLHPASAGSAEVHETEKKFFASRLLVQKSFLPLHPASGQKVAQGAGNTESEKVFLPSGLQTKKTKQYLCSPLQPEASESNKK